MNGVAKERPRKSGSSRRNPQRSSRKRNTSTSVKEEESLNLDYFPPLSAASVVSPSVPVSEKSFSQIAAELANIPAPEPVKVEEKKGKQEESSRSVTLDNTEKPKNSGRRKGQNKKNQDKPKQDLKVESPKPLSIDDFPPVGTEVSANNESTPKNSVSYAQMLKSQSQESFESEKVSIYNLYRLLKNCKTKYNYRTTPLENNISLTKYFIFIFQINFVKDQFEANGCCFPL